MSYEEIVKQILGNCDSFEEYEVSIAAGIKDHQDVMDDMLFLLSIIQTRETTKK